MSSDLKTAGLSPDYLGQVKPFGFERWKKPELLEKTINDYDHWTESRQINASARVELKRKHLTL